MSCVHYKFSSKLKYDTVTFDGLHISLCDLKKQIMGREKLKAADCDLQITNAQTKEGKRQPDPAPGPGRTGAGGRGPGGRLTAIAALRGGPFGCVGLSRRRAAAPGLGASPALFDFCKRGRSLAGRRRHVGVRGLRGCF